MRAQVEANFDCEMDVYPCSTVPGTDKYPATPAYTNIPCRLTAMHATRPDLVQIGSQDRLYARWIVTTKVGETRVRHRDKIVVRHNPTGKDTMSVTLEVLSPQNVMSHRIANQMVCYEVDV